VIKSSHLIFLFIYVIVVNMSEIRAIDPTFIHFFGIRRSGNHAVINWLQEGLNNEREESIMHINDVAEVLPTTPLPEIDPENIKSIIDRAHPGFVILSYEERTFTDRHKLEHRRIFSNSEDQDIVLLRSFPNVMASQIRRRNTVTSERRLDRPILRLGLAAVRDIWLDHAQVVLDAVGNGTTGILFDRWFTDRDYRDEIGDEIGFSNIDSGLGDVPNLMGVGGSSFDGAEFQGRAQQMDLLNRWMTFKKDDASHQLYLSLVTPGVIELNQELFGSNPLVSL
jgi:hypothetical protein